MKKPDRAPGVQTPVNLLKRTDAERYAAVLDLVGSQLVHSINARYAYWDEVKEQVPEAIRPFISPQDLWSIVKYCRRVGQRTLLIAGESFVFTATDTLYGQLHAFDQQPGTSLRTLNSVSDTDRHRYLIGATMEEAIASAQLDGATTAREVAKDMLRKQRPPRNPSEQLIANTYTALQQRTVQQQPLTPDALLTLHHLLTNSTITQPTNDEVATVNGNATQPPPIHDRTAAFMNDLCRFFNDETPDYFLHPVVKASIIHFLIGYFQPFADGNGRAARVLFYWYLVKRGYQLTDYLSVSRVIVASRHQYDRAYQCVEADDNDLGYFVHYQVAMLQQARDAFQEYVARKTVEKQQSSLLQRTDEVSARQATLLNWLRAEPSRILSVKEVETMLGTSNQTARTDLQGLVDKGYLTEVRINQKERQFALRNDS